MSTPCAFFRPSLTAAAVLAASALSAFGQGSLTPPGSPGPTMKTLDQIEARIPIPGGTAAFSVSTSGSYYLTGNLTTANTAIFVFADNVTLDLNGYTLTSASGSNPAYGVYVYSTGGGNVTVRNGHIRGQTTYGSGGFSAAGFGVGVYVQTTGGVRIEDVTVSGVSGNGIQVAGLNNVYPLAVISRCVVNVAGGKGIAVPGVSGPPPSASTLDHCVATPCANTALDALFADVSDCFGYSIGSGNGISAKTLSNSSGESASGYGVYADQSCTNCTGTGDNGTGLYTPGTAVGCTGVSNGTGNGVVASVATTCQGTANGTGTGLSASHVATDCSGYSTGGTGLYAVVATNCNGAGGGGPGTFGINCAACAGLGNATNCHGFSSGGIGLAAAVASACTGETEGTTLYAYGVDCRLSGLATGCYATAPSGATILRAGTANGCVLNGSSTKATITNRYNMPATP